MKVEVQIGTGMHHLHRTVDLVACPHAGDEVVINGESFHVDVVFIGADHVVVRALHASVGKVTFDAYLHDGWTS